jgi:hypothetical protein
MSALHIEKTQGITKFFSTNAALEEVCLFKKNHRKASTNFNFVMFIVIQSQCLVIKQTTRTSVAPKKF